jgi:hypothetical protein
VLGKFEQHKWRFRIAAPARGFAEKSKSRIWHEPREHTVRFAPLDFAQANQVMKEGVMTYERLELAADCCPNPFSLGLKRFLINLRLAPGDVKTRLEARVT